MGTRFFAGCFLLLAVGSRYPTKIRSTDMMDRFKPAGWTHNTTIYEVNLRQFTPEGTFRAFATHLPRLKAMGVQTLWFMPITPIAAKNRKGTLGSYYACSDYTSVNPEFGNLEDFRELVKQAHTLGMKVIIDWVANHTGWDHVWTKRHPDFYKRDEKTNDFRVASGMDDIIELDYDNPAMRKAMIDAMHFWVKECDIDGFRCDLCFWVTLDFWKEARKELDKVKHLFWLGEFDELENPKYAEAFDASYSWTWMHATEDFYKKKKPFDSLMKILGRYDDLGDHSMRTWFTSNHDENSWNGTEFEKYGDMADALAVFSATWNGVPLLYTGQEIPLKKRLKFFDKDPVDWQGKPGKEVFYKTLFQLRLHNPALRSGDTAVQTFRIKTDQAGRVFSYLRVRQEHAVFVILNFSDVKLTVSAIDKKLKGKFKNVFTGSSEDLSHIDKMVLPPWGWQVYEK
jgi:alpha-amylase